MTDSYTMLGVMLSLRRWDDQVGSLYSSEFVAGRLSVCATVKLGMSTVTVTCDGVQCSAGPCPMCDIETAWLEKASLETPRLANRVLDLIEAAK